MRPRKFRGEWVIGAAGKVSERGPRTDERQAPTAQIEIRVKTMEVLSTSPTRRSRQ
jgi:aspartyl-tRNA synthetase